MTVDKPKLHGIEMGYPHDVDYGVTDNLTTDLLSISKCAIKLGPTHIMTGTVVMSSPFV